MIGANTSHDIDAQSVISIVEEWERICLAAFQRIKELVTSFVSDMIIEEFKRFKVTGFQTCVRFIHCNLHI